MELVWCTIVIVLAIVLLWVFARTYSNFSHRHIIAGDADDDDELYSNWGPAPAATRRRPVAAGGADTSADTSTAGEYEFYANWGPAPARRESKHKYDDHDGQSNQLGSFHV